MTNFDFLGIGVGPANLSLAALAAPVTELTAEFLEAKPEFRWHPGLMLPDSQLTVTFFRDLVTLVDPTSRFSFLNFLVQDGRAFRFLEANGLGCSRREFEQYFQWAAAQLPSVRFGTPVESVALSGEGFEVTSSGGDVRTTRTLVLGSGSEPHLPDFAKPFASDSVLHSSRLTAVRPEWKGRRVLVVGAGQSGAEVVSHLLSDENALPSSLTWTSSRIGFQPLDDSPFTNEWFAAPFVDYFNGLSDRRRAEILREQKDAGGDGITDELVTSVYRRLYHLDMVLDSQMRHRLLPSRRAVGLERDGSHYVAELLDVNHDSVERLPVDLVIFCTGYRRGIPEYLKPLHDRLRLVDGDFAIRPDYTIDFDGPEDLKIYVQGLAERTHGIADSLLSLASWRSARILNSIAGREIHRVDNTTTTVAWR
ncbi:SidA/IucD/PvdA family monooxygenase [Streptomyces sp. NPDC047976]|uniref:lysine N(6)-hydroxylase/L-ornithine N(5)-oxygenase family protein n=1 Tax=unclassified Streptomyces TaxID=2593676 RepID=UPI00342954FD